MTDTVDPRVPKGDVRQLDAIRAIYTTAALRARLIIGATREDDWLEFKSDLGGDNARSRHLRSRINNS